LIRTKAAKIVARRVFRAKKYTKMLLRPGTPLGEVTALPQPSWFWGKGRRLEGNGKLGRGEERVGLREKR